MSSFFLLSIGAVLGAFSRWQLTLWLNPFFERFAFGTLSANWLGCFFIGIAIGLNVNEPQRILLITGFLGSFTTFSALSAELSEKLLAEKWLDFAAVLGLHLIGGVLLTMLGILSVRIATSGRFF